MPRVAPNYTFGIRLPWTLASEDNWRRTHRFAGRVFVVCGVALFACVLLRPLDPLVILGVAVGVMLLGICVIALYSYLLWRRG